jgi:hypothetical protein
MYEFSDYKDAEAYAQSIAKPPMLSGADKEYLNTRTAKLQAKLSMSETEWRALSDSQRNRITKGIIQANDLNDVQSTLRTVLGTTRGDRAFRTFRSNQGNSYSAMEIANLNREMRSIERANRQNGVWQSEAAELTYERTKLTRDLLDHSDEMRFVDGRRTPELLANSRTYMSNISNQISQIKDDLRTARRSGNSNAERVLKERLKMAKSTQRTIARVNLFGNIGQIEGYINSVRDYWNLQSVIKGDFFKSTKNQLYCPTEKMKFQWNGKDRVISEFMVPAHQKDGDPRRAVLQSYEEFFGRAYYFTPGSIFRTFFYNGEGFAWRAHLQKRKIEEFMRNSHITNFDFGRFANDRGYREHVLNGGLGVTNQEFLDMLDRYAKLGNMTEMFSLLYKTQEKVLGKINEKFFEPFRQKIYEMIVNTRIFSGLSDGTVAIGLLKKWAKDGGLRNLFKGLSQGIAEALGIAAGPGLNLLIGVIVGWVSERLYDLAVPLFGVLIYSIFGIIGVLVMSYGLLRKNSISYDVSASTPPGAVGYCEAEDSGFQESSKKFWGEPIPIPPPTDSSCPLGDIAYLCTQGFTDTTCTHSRMKAKKPVDIDGAGGNIQYFYAPKYCDRSNCTASTVINPGRCRDGNYTGQWVTFNDGQGNVFTLGHTKLIPPSNGSNYSAGEPVAYVYQNFAELIADDPEQRTSGYGFDCWTGSHIHLLITQNGAPIDPLAFLYEMGCVNGPSSEAECPPCRGADYD